MKVATNAPTSVHAPKKTKVSMISPQLKLMLLMADREPVSVERPAPPMPNAVLRHKVAIAALKRVSSRSTW